MVPKVGLEPTRYRYQRILSPSRLPFHHFGGSQMLFYYIGNLNAMPSIEKTCILKLSWKHNSHSKIIIAGSQRTYYPDYFRYHLSISPIQDALFA